MPYTCQFPSMDCTQGPYLNDVHNIFGFFDPPPPLSAFGTNLQYTIHATSLTSSAFRGHHLSMAPNLSTSFVGISKLSRFRS